MLLLKSLSSFIIILVVAFFWSDNLEWQSERCCFCDTSYVSKGNRNWLEQFEMSCVVEASVTTKHNINIKDTSWYQTYSFILEWTTSLDTSSRTLFVREDVHVTSNVDLRLLRTIVRRDTIERRLMWLRRSMTEVGIWGNSGTIRQFSLPSSFYLCPKSLITPLCDWQLWKLRDTSR